MKATILGEWEMELPELKEGDKWFLDWALRDPKHAGDHLTVSWRTFAALKEHIYNTGDYVTAVKEYFGGIGAHALMLQHLFEPSDHAVSDSNHSSVEHMQEVLPGHVRVCRADAYDPLTPWFADVAVLDFGDLTVHKAQPHLERGKLLDKVFSLDPLGVTVTDIAARYLHLQKDNYEKILGPGTCNTYEDYLEAFSRHIEERTGYVLLQGNYTRWSTVMAFVPNKDNVRHGNFYKSLPSAVSTPGLVIS
jgi:hypothetical protein